MDEKTRRKIERLQEKGLSFGEIADELNISIIDAINGLGYGYVKNDSKKKKRDEIGMGRKDCIRNLFLNEHKSIKEIADSLKISENFIREDLLAMGINPNIDPRLNSTNIGAHTNSISKKRGNKEDEETKAQRKKHVERIMQKSVNKSAIAGINERRKIVEDLYYNEGFSEDEISEATGISVVIVERDVEFLERHRKVGSAEFSKDEKEEVRKRSGKIKGDCKKRKIEARREKVARLYQEGKKQRKIAEELQVSISTVYNDIKQLLKDGKIGKREFDTEKKQEDEVKSINSSMEEIPEDVLGVSDVFEETEKMKNEREDEMSIKMKILDEERRKRQESRRNKVLSFYEDEGETFLSKIGAESSDTNTVKQTLQQIRSEIITLYEKGYTSEEIEKMTDYNWETISSVGMFYFETKYTLRRKSRINEKDRQVSRKILRLLKKGRSEEEISEETNIPYEVVCRYVKEFRDGGVLDNISDKPKEPKRKPNIYTKNTARKIVDLQMQGKGFGEIADELGIDSIIDILKILQHFGMENEYKKGHKEISLSRRNQALNLWETGGILSEISEKLGVDISVVMEDLISSGLSKSSIEEENGKRIELKMEQFKKSDMIRRIRLYYKKGDFESAKAYLEELQKEVSLSDVEKKEFSVMIENLEGLISRKNKQENNIPIGNVEIDDGEER